MAKGIKVFLAALTPYKGVIYFDNVMGGPIDAALIWPNRNDGRQGAL